MMNRLVAACCGLFLITACVSEPSRAVNSVAGGSTEVVAPADYQATLVRLTEGAARLVLDLISNQPGLTEVEGRMIAETDINIVYSPRFFASASFEGGQQRIQLSTAFAEAGFLLVSRLNPYRVSGSAECERAIELAISEFQARERTDELVLLWDQLSHNCEFPQPEDDHVLAVVSGFVSIPLAHELAHVLRGDIYLGRNESLEHRMMMEVHTDAMAGQLLYGTSLVYHGLPVFAFMADDDIKIVGGHVYLPPLCRARMLLSHSNIGFHADSPPSILRYATNAHIDIYKILISRMNNRAMIGRGIECLD